MKKYYGNDNFNLRNAYDDCKSVFENLTEDNFQSADFGLVAYYSNEIMYALEKILEQPQGEWIECTKSGMPLTEYGRMTGEKWYGFKCSRCNFIYKGNALVESSFCQKCGADMRGMNYA